MRNFRRTQNRRSLFTATIVLIVACLAPLTLASPAQADSSPNSQWYKQQTRAACNSMLARSTTSIGLKNRYGHTSNPSLTIRIAGNGDLCAYAEDNDGNSTYRRPMELTVRRTQWQNTGYDRGMYADYVGAIWHTGAASGGCRVTDAVVTSSMTWGGNPYAISVHVTYNSCVGRVEARKV